MGGLIWVGFVAFFVVALTVGVRAFIPPGFYLRFIRTRASRLEALAAG